jgi:hypothetical protein
LHVSPKLDLTTSLIYGVCRNLRRLCFFERAFSTILERGIPMQISDGHPLPLLTERHPLLVLDGQIAAVLVLCGVIQTPGRGRRVPLGCALIVWPGIRFSFITSYCRAQVTVLLTGNAEPRRFAPQAGGLERPRRVEL